MSSAIGDITARIKNGQTSARAEVEKALRRIEETVHYNVVISTLSERALQRADEIDKEIKAGSGEGRLLGVPFIVKDNFLTFGGKTTAASNMLRDFRAPYQATVIEKLEAEGAICVAKANLDAFAHGSSTENSDFGPTKNPIDIERVPGGSSGGSAAAVALDIVPFALGSDTGGSIRLPASYCGTVGLKPTYGLVSRYGVIAMASSTDVIGPLTKSVEDSALILDIIAGQDPRDGVTLPERDESYLPIIVDKPLSIGVVKEYMAEGVDPEVRSQIEIKIDRLRQLGHTVEEVSIPSVEVALAIYYIIVPAEISSNLSRFDGIKYGHRTDQAQSLDEVYGKSRAEGFNEENTRRIMIGNYVLSSGYYDAYYRKAQTARTLLINEFNAAFKKFDLLLGPTSPGPAFQIGAKSADPLQMYLVDIMTAAASVAGLPAISVPAGTVMGLPVGLQLIAPMRQDKKLLDLATQLEEAKV